MSAALLLLEAAEASEFSSVLRLTPVRTSLQGLRGFSGSKDALANMGLLLVSGLQPENEANSDHVGWCNRASRRDTGRRVTGTRASA